MKVVVRCAHNRVTKADMEREIERLFQENKDLRVQVGHLRDELAKSENESSQGMNAMAKFWEEAINEKNKAEERAEEYRIALMESDCRVDELEKQLAWVRNKNDEWAQLAATHKNVIAAQKEEKEALEDIVRAFEETRKDYEVEIHAQHVEKREWMQKYEELKAQKEADDKKSEEICTACNERYEEVLSERNHLREEVARLTDERNTAVHENTEMMFEINELQDKWEAEHNLRVEAEKAYDKVASEAYDMHQQITNLTVDNTRLENKVEELETEVDACHHNIDGYIEGNRRMRAEYEKKLEAEQDQTKYWREKYQQLLETHDELEENFDELERVHKLWGEEIDRLRKTIIDLQTNRFTTDEFIGMLMKNFMPSADK